jgi:hypothetical protein
MNKIKNMFIDCLYIGWFGGIISWFCGIFAPIYETDIMVSDKERDEAREHYKKQMGYKS